MDNKINMLENNDLYLISYVYNRNEGYGFGDTYKNGNEIQDVVQENYSELEKRLGKME